MTAAGLLERARAGDDAAFAELFEPLRRELQLHCYRIVGSVQDAEDLVQETLLAAWRGLDGFEGRASMRTWLYRIATNRSLNALRARGRRLPEPPPPPDEPGDPPPPSRELEPIWLEPYPDALLEGIAEPAGEPATHYESREAIGLAFLAGLQRLPPQQRAALVLRDVLGFRASETADILSVTEAAANGALRRAREGLRAGPVGGGLESAPLAGSAAEQEVVARFTAAFEAGDIGALVELLSDDASLTMPPQPLEYIGRAAIGRFFATVPAAGRIERIRLIPTRANGQPAFGCYIRNAQAPVAHAYGLMALTLRGGRITAITGFTDTAVFASFGLPRTLRE